MIKASNRLIANNLFEGVAYGALDLGPEFSSWGEADYVHNLTLTNNTIRDCNYISKAAAAFMLHGDGGNLMNGNSNVTIQGLTIDNTTASNMYIGASEAVSIGDVSFWMDIRVIMCCWRLGLDQLLPSRTSALRA